MSNYSRVERLLHSYKTIEAEIKNLKLDIEDIREDIENNITLIGTNFGAVDSGRCSARNNSSKVESDAIRQNRRIEDIEREIRKKSRLLMKIDNALEQLTEEDRKFVVDRYFNKVTMNDLAIVKCVDRSTMYKRKDAIMEKLCGLL